MKKSNPSVFRYWTAGSAGLRDEKETRVGSLFGGTFRIKVQGGALTHTDHNIPIVKRQKPEFSKEIMCTFVLYVYYKTRQRMPNR